MLTKQRMEVHIDVGKEDIGFKYESIKSLLEKFSEVEKRQADIALLRVSLGIGTDKLHELSEALVWRIMRHYQSLSCKKEVMYSQNVKFELENVRFLDRLTGKKTQKTTDGSVPVDFETFEPFRGRKTEQNTISAEDVYQKAMKETLSPDDEFHNEISNNIYEILNNVFDHSELSNEAGIICVKSDSGVISVCAVDMGQGIKSSFMSNPYLGEDFSKIPDEDMILKATKFKSTCNPRHARNPNYVETTNGGIGLYYLKNFSRMHRDGQLVIISNKGYYYTDHTGREKTRNFQTVSWPGTLVFFRVNLKQKLNPKYVEFVQSA